MATCADSQGHDAGGGGGGKTSYIILSFSKTSFFSASMTPCLFEPASHSDHNGFYFNKPFPGSASTCTPPAFRCRERSWPFFSSRLVLLLALRILDRIPRTELYSTLCFFNFSFFAVSQVCWAHLFWLSDREP